MQVGRSAGEEWEVGVEMSLVLAQLISQHLTDGKLQVRRLDRSHETVPTAERNRQASARLFALKSTTFVYYMPQ